MSDEPPDDNPAWRLPARGPDPVDQDVLSALAGRIDPTRPIGPLILRLRSRRPYVLAAVAVAALLGGAGAALVVTDSPPPVPAHNAAAPGPAPASSPANIGSALPGVLHGQFVMRKAGGFQTVEVQTGQVTAVSSTSITIRSTDGFTHSYTVVTGTTIVDAGHGGISSVKAGDQVSVDATVSGSTDTAAGIDDLTLLRQRGASA
jgi:hypothetical protein